MACRKRELLCVYHQLRTASLCFGLVTPQEGMSLHWFAVEVVREPKTFLETLVSINRDSLPPLATSDFCQTRPVIASRIRNMQGRPELGYMPRPTEVASWQGLIGEASGLQLGVHFGKQ